MDINDYIRKILDICFCCKHTIQKHSIVGLNNKDKQIFGHCRNCELCEGDNK